MCVPKYKRRPLKLYNFFINKSYGLGYFRTPHQLK